MKNKTGWLRVSLSLAVLLCFLTALTVYSQGRGRGRQGRGIEVQSDTQEQHPSEKARGKAGEEKPGAGKFPHTGDRDWVPPGLSEEETSRWRETGPPGWTKGEKEGWEGKDMPPGLSKQNKMPPGLQKKLPPQHEDRNFFERWRWNRQLEAGRREISHAAESTEGLDHDDKTGAEIALEAAARSGVPVEEVKNVLKKAIEQRRKGQEMEVITRAMSYGVDKGTDFSELRGFINNQLEEGVKGENIAVQIYKRIAENQ